MGMRGTKHLLPEDRAILHKLWMLRANYRGLREAYLCAAVLHQATSDLMVFAYKSKHTDSDRSQSRLKVYRETCDWFNSYSMKYGFTFEFICEVLCLDSDTLRNLFRRRGYLTTSGGTVGEYNVARGLC